MKRTKTDAQLDKEIEQILRTRSYKTQIPHAPAFRRQWPTGRRYRLVNADTGEDMRAAHDFEVDQIHASRSVVSMPLAAGTYNVMLRDADEILTLKNRKGEVLAEGHNLSSIMKAAPDDKSYATVSGEYTSDGTYWGRGHGRTIATRESRPSHGFRWYVSHS